MTDSIEVPDAGEVPAAPDSFLAGLRERKKKAESKLHLDLFVPRMEPETVVRYRPIAQREVDAANTAAARSKDKDRLVVGNAAVLAHACVAVFPLVDGKPPADLDTYPRFDEDLAEALGLPRDARAADIVRALYFTDGDVIAAAEELGEWSAQARRRVDEETEGN